MKTKLFAAAVGLIGGLILATIVFDLVNPPGRVTYAFVGTHPPFYVEYAWHLTLMAGAVLGAAIGWSSASLVLRRRHT